MTLVHMPPLEVGRVYCENQVAEVPRSRKEHLEHVCDPIHGDPGAPYGFSGLLRLDSRSKPDPPLEVACGPGSLFDDIKKRCRPVTCPYHRTFTQERCEPFLEQSNSIVYRAFSMVRPTVDMSVKHLYDVMPELRSEFEDIINILGYGSICTSQIMIVLNDCFSEDDESALVDSIEFLIDIATVDGPTIDETVTILLGLDGRNITVDIDSIGVIRFDISLKDDRREYNTRTPYGDFYNWQLAGTPVPLQSLIASSFIENGRHFIPYFYWNESPGTCFSMGITLRLLTMRPCPMFSVNRTEFDLIETPYGLTFCTSKEVVVGLSEYVKDDNHQVVRMCVETYRRMLRTFVTNDVTVDSLYSAELIVSIVSVSVSVVCLVISLFTYCYLPQLQTLPGKNNMALIVSLLLAQGMYLLSSYGRLDTASFSCKLVGGLTHFFWLLSIFWMNVCTFHMFRVLVRTRNVSGIAPSNKHILYHVYSIVMSVIFVTVNVIVSMVTSKGSDYGYGDTRCYVSTQRMVEMTFGIPAAIVVIANLSMFITIIIKLKRAPTVNKNVKHERNYVVVFAKLSTITGATWLFGFVYMWTGITAFSFVFTILNGCQGLFLMLSFVWNVRTLTMLKDRSRSFRSSISRTHTTKTHSASGCSTNEH